jgi:hypothetical protein
MSVTGLAIYAILAIAIAMWLLQVVLNPKHWRLMWLDFFGVLDTDTTREERHAQEAHLRFLALILCLLVLATSISCAFWSADQVRENLRPKTTAERELEDLQKRAEGLRRR